MLIRRARCTSSAFQQRGCTPPAVTNLDQLQPLQQSALLADFKRDFQDERRLCLAHRSWVDRGLRYGLG